MRLFHRSVVTVQCLCTGSILILEYFITSITVYTSEFRETMSALKELKRTFAHTFRLICVLCLWLASLPSLACSFRSSFIFLPTVSFVMSLYASFHKCSYLHSGFSSTFYYQGAAAHSKWSYLEAIEGDICVIREELHQAQCAVCFGRHCRRRNQEQPQNRNISRCFLLNLYL